MLVQQIINVIYCTHGHNNIYFLIQILVQLYSLKFKINYPIHLSTLDKKWMVQLICQELVLLLTTDPYYHKKYTSSRSIIK